ncbi:variant erythrocyte surface antigen-1 family protein [Babesia caballi]|uniref:Variant erythrocyte surface antigen-1 family protein n=1 Tax=Babesia caballi TaxID=5871 RepID=A0AAV4LRZ3_BABCB|nr:variant erythrocyte surface antigen-1 family protein [Babesia caballi]
MVARLLTLWSIQQVPSLPSSKLSTLLFCRRPPIGDDPFGHATCGRSKRRSLDHTSLSAAALVLNITFVRRLVEYESECAAAAAGLGKELTDSPSNLKEAIDWILRVTGKYGGSSGDGATAITALTEQVKHFFEPVKVAGSGVSSEHIEKVREALSTSGSDNGLIGKLAEGLQQFIGYEGKDGGKIRPEKGIAVSNLPLERLRDAVLMFIGPFLGVLRYTHPGLKNYSTQLGEAVEACKKGLGCGKDGLEVFTVASVVTKNVLEKVKNVSEIKSNQSSVNALADKVKNYFKNVLQKVENDSDLKTNATQAKQKIETLKGHLETLVPNVGKQDDGHPINVGENGVGGQQSNGLKSYIDAIYAARTGALTQLRGAFPNNNHKAFALSAAAYNGVNLFVTVLQTDYTSYYKGATWNQVSGDGNHKTCAKVFIACLPLIFNGLSYFYWKCSGKGGWNDMTLGSPEPKAFMGLTSIGPNRVKSGRKGEEVVSKAFKAFEEFSKCTSNTTSYAEFLKTFRGNCLTNWQSSSNATASNFLSGLYLCSTSYFRHQHQKKAATARPPSSIREMLYWLMGLTATPQFGDLLGHIDNVVGTNFHVAVSGSSKTGETLSADQVTSYILSTCYTCPSVLDIIQGRVPPQESNDKPWLHDLYSNSAFPFKYPSSGAALFYALSDYTYALQFQLGFFFKQCQDMYTNTCGWQFCTFGKKVNATLNDKVVPSHICSVGCSTSSHNGGNHASGYCGHEKCGQESSKPSPLQAFLTDNLRGFSRGHPADPSSHLASCSGSLCHVPMGFESHLRDGSVQGGNISLALKPFCGSHNTPLRQLCGALTCFSKRAPRSLGDLFGFYWQVTGQLFNDVKKEDKDPTSSLTGAISTLLSKLTTVKSGLLYESITANVESIGSHFFGLSWHCHRKHNWRTDPRSASKYCNDHSNSNKARDLMSLYDSECTQNSATCGKYLESLGISSGTIFANNYAYTYLSWAAYLTDELYESLQEFLDTLNGHACKGCQRCSDHSSQCQCASVVDCADVLPHLYANGFNFKDAFSLKGMEWQDQTKKNYKHETSLTRSCQKFHTQLTNVLSPDAPSPNCFSPSTSSSSSSATISSVTFLESGPSTYASFSTRSSSCSTHYTYALTSNSPHLTSYHLSPYSLRASLYPSRNSRTSGSNLQHTEMQSTHNSR